MADLDTEILSTAEAAAARGRPDLMFEALRKLSLEQFGALTQSPPEGYPNLRGAVPRMPSDEIQKNWTGACGERLLKITIAFVKELEAAFTVLSRSSLGDSTVLDFGCGWGRIMRLMYRSVQLEKLYGVDPWSASLDICRNCGLLGKLALSDYVPRSLPFGDTKFDLIYAYSVFTHLSPRTADTALATLHHRLAPGGLLVITVRPEEFWSMHAYWPDGATPEKMIARHRAEGVAYLPHLRMPIDGDITYGDTSMSLEYIERTWGGQWTIAAEKPMDFDPPQHLVYLKARR